MRISVIIPVLNKERSIATTLTAPAPLKPYELIIVDGGSTDRTVEICNRLGATVFHRREVVDCK